MPIDPVEKEKKLKLLEIVREAVRRDNALREKYQVGEKFRFIRDQLSVLLDQVEKHAKLIADDEEKKIAAAGVAADETIVYVYLYNVQGLVVSSWLNMLTSKLFYEYSVNRPIYGEKAHIEALIRSKTTKTQHAYLTVIVSQKDIETGEEKLKQDALGNRVLKVKEGGLHFNRLQLFTHNDIDYILDENGKLIRKNPA